MKTLLAGLMGFIIAMEAAAQVDIATVSFAKSGTGGSISLDAREVGTSKSVQHNWETSWGSYDREFFRSKTLGVEVTKFGDAPVKDVSLEVVWLAQKVADKSPFVYSHQTSQMVFAGARFFKTQFTMPELKSNVTNYEALGEQYVSGSKVLGWIVYARDTATGQVYRHKASSPTVEQIARGPIAQMLSVYKQRSK